MNEKGYGQIMNSPRSSLDGTKQNKNTEQTIEVSHS